jgi:hypothetical protein
MSAASNWRLIGHWRIIEADLWDRGYLDLVEPAAIKIGAVLKAEKETSS